MPPGVKTVLESVFHSAGGYLHPLLRTDRADANPVRVLDMSSMMRGFNRPNNQRKRKPARKPSQNEVRSKSRRKRPIISRCTRCARKYHSA